MAYLDLYFKPIFNAFFGKKNSSVERAKKKEIGHGGGLKGHQRHKSFHASPFLFAFRSSVDATFFLGKPREKQ